MLASVFKPNSGIDLSHYWVSEKYDRVRAFWDGSRLISRQGNEYHAPSWFVKNFPKIALDGELWLERGRFDSDNIFSFLPDRIICNSSAVRNRFTKDKIDAKIRTILNGVDLSEFNPELNGSIIRKEFNIDEDEI